jgi:hypothetical protein
MAEIPGITATDTTRTPGPIPAELQDQTEANAKVAAQVAGQDNLASSKVDPEAVTDTKSALDDLLRKKQAEDAEEPARRVAKGTAGESPAEQPDPNAVEEAEKAAKEAAAQDASKIADQKLAEDIFKDAPQLPAGASAKSHEAFAHIKVQAAKDVSAARKEADDLKKLVADLEAKSNAPLPEDIQKRLDEADLFRAKLDIEADPHFKANTKKIASAQDFIYAQLKKSPVVTDAMVEKIKALGGPENADLSRLFEQIKDPVVQRLVDAKVSEIETIKYEQDKARETAKANVSEYIRERQEAFSKGAVAHNTHTKQFYAEITKNQAWANVKPVPPNATAEEQASIKAHNALVESTSKEITSALNDDSPQMRAILLMGMGELFHVQNQLKGSQAIVATKDTVLAEKDKAIADLNATIARLKNSGATRIREGGAPQAGGVPKPSTTADSLSLSTRDALNMHAKQVMEARAAAGR